MKVGGFFYVLILYIISFTTSLKTSSSHIPIITSLRGIAALSVVLYHFVCKTIGYIQNETVLDIFEYGRKGVNLFFIISGIVIPLSMIGNNYQLKKFGNFMLRRIIRIEPPYLVAVVMGIVYLYVRNLIPGTVSVDMTPSAIEIFLHVGYLIPFFEDFNWINPVFWTLSIEFQYYLLLSLLIPLVMQEKALSRILFYLIFLSMSYLPISNDFLPAWGSLFMAGIVYALFHSKTIDAKEFLAMFSITLISIYFTLGLVDVILSILAITFIYFLPKIKSRLTVFLGNISYSLYLIHSITGAAVINYLSHKYILMYQKFIVIGLGLAISILISYLLYKFVEKPTHEYAKRMKK
ncbi:MAG: acyltransferase [Crocinitomicaceae bacterium]|nr:acyltransferase [Crocinitomicaceae bacterium]